MPKAKTDALRPVAETLLDALRGQRAQGNYPLALGRLLELLGPLEPDIKERALKHKLCRDQIIVARAGDPQAPVALREDLSQLAGSDRVLVYLLELVSTSEDWKCQPSKLAAKLAAPLKKPFLTATLQKVEQRQLPPPAGSLRIKNKVHLFLRQLVPTEAKPLLLAEQLLDQLTAWRQQADYPPSLERLQQSLPEPIEMPLLQKMMQEAPLKSRLLWAVPNNTTAPVALIEDQDRLAGSPALLRFLLASCERSDHQAPALKDLKKILAKKLQTPFEQAILSEMEQGTLSADVGWLRINKAPHLFFLHHVHGERPRETATAAAPAAAAPAAPLNFEQTFREAFDQLDRQSGSHNFVSLVELRKMVPFPRAAFDAELLRLRRLGRYTLSAAEGRHGIGPDQQAAGIQEEGSLLLFVSKGNAVNDNWIEIP